MANLWGDDLNIVNLTPHSIRVLDEEDKLLAIIPKSGKVARVNRKEELIGKVYGVPIYNIVFGSTTNLPEPKENTLYLVSLMVLQNVNRKDLITPDTMTAVRDNQGKIIGVKQFKQQN